MPLLRSLADRATRVAINMALLTELIASPPPTLRLVKNADAFQKLRPRACLPKIHLADGPLQSNQRRGILIPSGKARSFKTCWKSSRLRRSTESGIGWIRLSRTDLELRPRLASPSPARQRKSVATFRP